MHPSLSRHRLMFGSHCDHEYDLQTGEVKLDEKGKPYSRLYKSQQVCDRNKIQAPAGHDIVVSKKNLAKDWPDKFVPVSTGEGGLGGARLPSGMEMLPNETMTEWYARVGKLLESMNSGPLTVGGQLISPAPTGTTPAQTEHQTLEGKQGITEGQADTLKAMTFEELKTFAADEEIELGGARSKADILKIVLNHLGFTG